MIGLKILGACLIMLGSLGLSYNYCGRQRKKLTDILLLQEILEFVEGEIRYSQSSLPECFLQAGLRQSNELGRMFQEIGEGLIADSGENLKKLTERILDEKLKQILTYFQRKQFYDFVSPEGYRDEQMQRRQIRRCIETLEDTCRQMKERQKERNAVVWSLGGLGGAFLVVLLL